MKWTAMIIGVLISVTTTVLMCASTAIYIINGSISEKWMTYMIFVILLIATYMGVKSNTRITSAKKRNVCWMTGLIFLLILLIFNLLFDHGVFKGVIPKALAVFAGSSLGCVRIGQKRKGRVPRKRKHYR